MASSTILAHSFHLTPTPNSTISTKCFLPFPRIRITNTTTTKSWSLTIKSLTLSPKRSERLTLPIRSSLSSSNSTQDSSFTVPISIPFLSTTQLSQVTPLAVCKWVAVAIIMVAAVKKVVALLLSPFFWMYFSWTWMYWPWYPAVGIASYGVFCVKKRIEGESGVFQQIATLTAAVTWLTLVPPAFFNGYLQGWPIAFFFIYHYFFFFESSVRKRLYGDLLPRKHDKKWDIKLPKISSAGFAVLVFLGHWLAGLEGKELHLVSGGWTNVGIWGLILMVLFMRYHSVLYLHKYSIKVSEPTAVVQFGPYRWIRHPIYASTMLLFALYCIALRAPLSLGFLVAVCLAYYGHKAALEEDLMIENFRDGYTEYSNKLFIENSLSIKLAADFHRDMEDDNMECFVEIHLYPFLYILNNYRHNRPLPIELKKLGTPRRIHSRILKLHLPRGQQLRLQLGQFDAHQPEHVYGVPKRGLAIWTILCPWKGPLLYIEHPFGKNVKRKSFFNLLFGEESTRIQRPLNINTEVTQTRV